MCIDRNLRNVKDRPYCPIRCCLKKTGPLDDALTAIAITRNRGAHTINTRTLTTISINRLMPNSGRLLLSLVARSGYKAGLLGRPEIVMIPIIGKEVKRDADPVKLL